MLSEILIADVIIIANIVLIECLLSLDNAAVLAVIVNSVEPKKRTKLLAIGVTLAYAFRVLALLTAFWLIKYWELQLLGGLYLLYLGIKSLFFSSEYTPKAKKTEEEDQGFIAKVKRFLRLTPFVSAVIAISLTDLVFSLDNVFVVVALTDNIYIIWFGVLVAIISMAFVVRFASKMINDYPALKTAVLIVIILLGLKLIITSIAFVFPYEIQTLIHHKASKLIVSGLIIAIFGFTVLGTIISRRSIKG